MLRVTYDECKMAFMLNVVAPLIGLGLTKNLRLYLCHWKETWKETFTHMLVPL